MIRWLVSTRVFLLIPSLLVGSSALPSDSINSDVGSSSGDYVPYGDVSRVSLQDVLSGEFSRMFFVQKMYSTSHLEVEYRALLKKFNSDGLNTIKKEVDALKSHFELLCTIHNCSVFASIPEKIIERVYEQERKNIKLENSVCVGTNDITLVVEFKEHNRTFLSELERSTSIFKYSFIGGLVSFEDFGKVPDNKTMTFRLRNIGTFDEFETALSAGYAYAVKAEGMSFGLGSELIVPSFMERQRQRWLQEGRQPDRVVMKIYEAEFSMECDWLPTAQR